MAHKLTPLIATTHVLAGPIKAFLLFGTFCVRTICVQTFRVPDILGLWTFRGRSFRGRDVSWAGRYVPGRFVAGLNVGALHSALFLFYIFLPALLSVHGWGATAGVPDIVRCSHRPVTKETVVPARILKLRTRRKT